MSAGHGTARAPQREGIPSWILTAAPQPYLYSQISHNDVVTGLRDRLCSGAACQEAMSHPELVPAISHQLWH